MFGRIQISDPAIREFSLEAYDSERFSRAYKSAYRPQTYSQNSIEFFQLGTVTSHSSLALVAQSFLSRKSTESFLDNLDGLFFIYIFDSKTSRHYLFNNHYQLTKLYYVEQDGELLFADRLTTLLPKLKQVKAHLPSVVNFLSNGFNSSEQTQIQGVKKLLPTFWIEVSPSKVQFFNRWKRHYTSQRKPFGNLDEHLDQYESTYQEALNNYLENRRPDNIGTLLSGGHDTSFTLIQLSRVCPKPIHCFTTTFPNWGFNEHSYAEAICKKFGGVFHPLPFEGKHLESIADLIDSAEEPVLGSSLPLHVLANKASQYTDTILGGDGGDTLWGEYYPVGEYHRWVKNWPLFWRSQAHNFSKALRSLGGWERFWELEHVTGLFNKPDPYPHFMQSLCTYRHFNEDFKKELLKEPLASTPMGHSQLEISFTKENFQEALIEGKLFNAFFTYQSFQQTRSMNAFGMEFFLPTIQRNVMNFINSLPMNWINGGTTFHRMINSKSINRKFHKFALARYLKREEIYNRSFDIPWHLLFSSRSYVLEKLKKSLLRRGWFNENSLNSLFLEFQSQRNKDYELLELRSHGYRIMTLLSLEIWCRRYLDNTPRSQLANLGDLEEYLDQ